MKFKISIFILSIMKKNQFSVRYFGITEIKTAVIAMFLCGNKTEKELIMQKAKLRCKFLQRYKVNKRES